jgi:hypothetical protein
LPKSPLDFIFGKDIAVDGQYDIDRAEKFIEQIQSIHQVVKEQLEKSQAKYKTRHEKHRVDHSFQVGDEVCLYISKERLKGEGKKLKPIRYGPFKIILDRRMRTSKRGNVEYLQVGLKGTNPSKAKWIEVGRVRELYPHLHID